MKNLRLLTLGVALAFGSAYTQTAQDKAEQSVTITQGPTITNITGDSATIKWTTDKVAANHVKYRPVTGGEWKSEFEGQGTKDHQLQMTGLQPNTTYEYQILTREKNVRTSGQFKTASTAAGKMPDVQGTGGSMASTSSSGSSYPGPVGSQTSASTSSTSSGQVAPNANFTPNAPNGRVTLYRAVNPSNNVHTFVTSQASVPAGFTQEGVAGYLIGRQVGTSVPLYGIVGANGDYFYTTADSERQQALAAGGRDLGLLGYIASKQERNTVPMYRMVDAQNRHFYTVSEDERAQSLRNGAKDEGTIGYVWTR
jgi:hypothetical protein